MRKLTILLAALLMGACGGGNTLQGTVSVHLQKGTPAGNWLFSIAEQDEDLFKALASADSGEMPCPGLPRGYDDIRDGTSVEVVDGSGNTLAIGRLRDGRFILPRGERGGAGCQFEFSVDVPNAEFYKISVSHRSGGTYDRAELEAQDWTVDLSMR